MKKIILSLLILISLEGFSQVLFTEDFDGSNPNPPVLSTGANCFENNQDYFGIFDDATVGASYANDTGNFLTGQDVDECTNGGANNTQTATFSGINIAGCTDLYICVDIAEDDIDGSGNPDYDLDDNDGIEFNIDIDGTGSTTVFEFKSVASNSEAYAGDDPTASCILTDDFVTYCTSIPAGNSLDLEVAFRTNGGSEDTATDNIQVICGVANLPAGVNYNSCFSTLFCEDFDGSNITNPPVLSTTGPCFENNQDYFGIFDDSAVGASYTNDTGNFLTGQDVDECTNGNGGNTQTATFSGIDITGCTSDLWICLDIAEDDLAGDGSVDLDLDDNDGIEFNVSVDGSGFSTVIEFKAVASNSESYAGDSDLSTCTLTDDFITYCAVVPAGASLDLEVAIRSNGGSEDTAVDNIKLVCGEANLPTGSVEYGSCLPMCNSSLVITEVMTDPCTGGTGTTDCMGGTGTFYPSGEANGQWVEIYNYGTTATDLSGYLIGDENNGDIYEIPAGTMIAPGEYLVIAHELVGNCMIAAGINAVVGLDPGTTNPQNNNTWNQADDDVELKDPIGTICDIISQYPGGICSDQNYGYSYSLSLDPSTFVDGSENDNLADWGPSLNGAGSANAGGGSPGAANTMGACISNLATVTATCNGSNAEFTVTFDFEESFATDYDILVDGVVNTTSTGNNLGTGSVSQVITIPNSTPAGDIDIEVRVAGADANLCNTIESLNFPLPDCAVDCSLMSGTCNACPAGDVTTMIDLTAGTAFNDAGNFGGSGIADVVPNYDNATNTGTLTMLEDQSIAFVAAGISGLTLPCVVNDLCFTADIDVVSGAPFNFEFRIENGTGAPGNGGQALVFDAAVDGTGMCSIGGGLADGTAVNGFTFTPCTVYTIAFALADFDGTPVESDIVVDISNVQLSICSPAPVGDDTGTVCSGGGTDDLTAWQTAVEAANPAGLVFYSSVTPVAGTTPPDGTLPDGINGAGCATLDQTVMAYKFCDLDGSGGDSAGDTYDLQSTYTLTVSPPTQDPNVNPDGCLAILTQSCPNDVFSAPTNPTGGAAAANFDTTTGIYSGQPGDAAGTLDITVTNEFNCTASTFTFNTPICAVACPTVIAEDGNASVCDGGLTTEIADWQTAVTATNAAVISDANTDAAIVYSTLAIPAVAMPNGMVADGIHSGADLCATETQTTYAYIVCYGSDATAGTADDEYLLLGTHTLSVYPNAQAPTVTIMTAGTPASPTCTYMINYACPGDTGGTVATEACGTAGANQDLTITTANACSGTFSVAVPACIACDCPTPVPTATGASYCDGDLIADVTATGVAGATFNWYLDVALTMPATGTSGANNEIWTPMGSIGTETVYVTQFAGGCEGPFVAVNIDVQALPTIAGTVNNPSSCGGTGSIDLAFTDVPDGAYTLNYTGGSFAITVTGGMASITGLSAGNYDGFSLTVNTCTSNQVLDFVLSEPAVPTPPAAAGGVYCVGTNISDVVATGDAGATFDWYLDATLTMPATGTSGANNEIWTPSAALGIETVYVIQTLNNCVSGATAVAVELIICTGQEFEATNNFMATDPCACNNDQTLNVSGDGEGTFSEVVTVEGPGNILVRVIEADQTGMLGLTFPAMLTETAVGSGIYEIAFNHADGQGYFIERFEYSIDGGLTWITVTDIGGNIVSVGNTCIYPQTVTTGDLDFCVDGVPVILSDGVLGLSEVNNNPGNYSYDFGAGAVTTFDPSIGVGNYPLAISFTSTDDGFAGISPDKGETAVYPGGCMTSTNILVNVEECPTDNYGVERACAGNALYVVDANVASVLPTITNAVYTWYLLNSSGGWDAVATVNGIPYYSPQTPGTYSVSMDLSSGCSCLIVGDVSMTVDEIIDCDNCGN